VYVLSNVTPRCLRSEQKGRVSLLWLTFNSRLASLLRWKTADTALVVLSFWRYSSTVDMCLLSTTSTEFMSPSARVIARSLVYVYFLETVVGKSDVCV